MDKLLIKDTLRTVKHHFSRYISILLIVALGIAFFVGIKAASPDMFYTAENYFNTYNLADLRLRSTIGFTQADLEAIRAVEDVEYASGTKFTDAFVFVNGEAQLDIDGTFITTRAYSISPADITDFIHGLNNGSYLNRVQLIEGRYPQQKNECLVDASNLSTPETFRLGNVITLKNGGNEAPDALNTDTFSIVGIIRSPLFISFERGNTNIGSGKLGTFIVIPEEAFTADYYTEISVKIRGAQAYEPFSDEYFDYTQEALRKIEEASPKLIEARVKTLRPDLSKKIAESEQQIAAREAELTNGIQQLDAVIATLQPLVDNGQKIVEDAEKEFNEKFSQVEAALNENTSAYQRALSDFSQKKKTLTERQAEYDTKQTMLTKSKETYDTLYNQYTDATGKLNTTRSNIATTKSLINAASDVLNRLGDSQSNAYSNEQIQSVITVMQGTYPDLYSSVKALTTSGLAGEIVANLSPYIETQKAELAKQELQLEEYSELLDALGERLATEKTNLENATLESQKAYQYLQQAAQDLDNYSAVLSQQGYNIQTSTVDIAIQKMQAENDLNELKKQVQNAPAQLAEAKAKREEITTQSESALSFAKSELADAKSLYESLDHVKWTLMDRNATPGYTSYGQSVKNIEVLSNIFPIFFFVISSLVCLTTVTRLVEEDRTLLGTYRALGCSNKAIMAKYIAYSLSACIFGTVLGLCVGVFLFPYAINSAYSIMYSLPPITYRFPLLYAAIGFGIALLSTAVVTFLVVYRDLHLKPAVLMRPKAPKKGKRILLEYVPFIWTKLSFTAKVTARNLFRNKSRFSMTLAGIAGCTALLLASLGFYNSIYAIKAKQFDDANAIMKYDLQVVFDHTQTSPMHTPEFQAVSSDARISEMCLVSLKNMAAHGTKSDKELEVYVFVPEVPSMLNAFIDLRTAKGGQPLSLTDNGALITEKLAKATNTNVGDEIVFEDTEGNSYSVPVAAVTENYTFHYIYITPALYASVTGAAPTYGYAIGNISESLKYAKQTDLNNLKGLLAGDIMKIDDVATVAFLSDTTNNISEVTGALSLVILVFFFSALILAFIVLYNLANINIIERTRELATLKVLGFTDTEVNRYILRENMIVSLFGIAFGIALGLGLHRLLITFTAIDTVMYGQTVAWYAYALAVGITALFIAGVNLLLRRKTAAINMVESLKSVE